MVSSSREGCGDTTFTTVEPGVAGFWSNSMPAAHTRGHNSSTQPTNQPRNQEVHWTVPGTRGRCTHSLLGASCCTRCFFFRVRLFFTFFVPPAPPTPPPDADVPRSAAFADAGLSAARWSGVRVFARAPRRLDEPCLPRRDPMPVTKSMTSWSGLDTRYRSRTLAVTGTDGRLGSTYGWSLMVTRYWCFPAGTQPRWR